MPWAKYDDGLRLNGRLDSAVEQHFSGLLQDLAESHKLAKSICSQLKSVVDADAGERTVQRETVWQLSKWCHWRHKKSQTIARKTGDFLFGMYPQPRFVDDHGRPIPDEATADARYREWVEGIVGFEPLLGARPPVNGSHMIEELDKIVRCFRQVILYGPPGTGKTRIARHMALHLLTGQGPPGEEADVEKQLAEYRDKGRYDLVVFHPSYEYEQFVGGIAPETIEGAIHFKSKAGPFLRLCRSASLHNEVVVLIVDEINRGNLPKLLGELVFALEYRGSTATLPFEHEGDSGLRIPRNMYLIATMNSADRSIGHIDVAIRRRFGLYHLPPDAEVVRENWRQENAEYGESLARLMTRLNHELASEDPAVDLGVGQSYFIPGPSATEAGIEPEEQVRMKWRNQVYPLLHEYAQLVNLGSDFFKKYPEDLDEALSKKSGGV